MDKWNLKSRSEGKPFASDVMQGKLPEPTLNCNGFDRAGYFHSSFGMQRSDSVIMPTVSERLLRGKLLLEETIETLVKGLGLRLQVNVGNIEESLGHTSEAGNFIDVSRILELRHIEGDLYDPVETLDGLADVKAIANGTAVAFGLPMDEADYEVFCSNMTKLDESGKPIVNRPDPAKCIDPDSCVEASHLLDPSQPVGKVLKSAQYTPANIAGVIHAEIELVKAQQEGAVES